MFEIGFEVNGRKVRPQDIRDALTQAILSNVAEQVKRKVSTLRCPEHGKAAKILCKGRSLDDLSFEISGCCDRLINEVRRNLG